MALAPTVPIPSRLFEDAPQRPQRDVSFGMRHDDNATPVRFPKDVMIPFRADQRPAFAVQSLNDLSARHGITLHTEHTNNNLVQRFDDESRPSFSQLRVEPSGAITQRQRHFRH